MELGMIESGRMGPRTVQRFTRDALASDGFWHNPESAGGAG